MTTLNTANYTVGQAELYFDSSPNHASLDAGTTNGIGSDFRTTGRNFGNIVTMDIAPEVTYLDHMITTSGGDRRKDLTVANSKTITVPFTFDEINEANFRKYLFGTDVSSSVNAAASPAFTVMTNVLDYGSAQLYFRTDVGNDFVWMIPKCTIRPDGNMTLNAEDWWQAPMVLEIFYTSTWDPSNEASGVEAGTAPYGIVSFA